MTVESSGAERKKKTGGVTGKGFMPGRSGNPGGRAKGASEVREMARAHTATAIERLAFWAASNEPSASVAACNALLDRAWGKAPVKFDDDDGKSGLTVIIKREV